MRASILQQTGNLLAAGVAAGFLLGIAAPAQARGLVADENFPTLLLPTSTCDLGSQCVASIPFAGTSIYVYTDGAISIGGSPLDPSLGDLPSFGSNYIAAGLADYSALDMGVWAFQSTDLLQLSWIFTVPSTGGKQALFGIDLTHNLNGSFTAEVGSGGAFFTWFGNSTAIATFSDDNFKPYCDATCVSAESTDPDAAVYGVYLPDGALIGSSFDGKNEDTNASLLGPWSVGVDPTYPNYTLNFSLSAPTSAPEPATWAMMGFGLGAMAMMRRRLRRRPAAARA